MTRVGISAGLANWIARFGFLPLATDSGGLRQPLHAEDLALAVLAALVTEESEGRTLVVAGEGAISYRTISARMPEPGRSLPTSAVTVARLSAL